MRTGANSQETICEGAASGLELIVRRVDARDEFREEVALRVAHTDKIDGKNQRIVERSGQKDFEGLTVRAAVPVAPDL